MLEYPSPKSQVELLKKSQREAVRIVGIGGAGLNIIDRMLIDGMELGEVLVLHTDSRSIETSVVSQKIQLGKGLTMGLGTGGDPELGYQAALETKSAVKEALEGYETVFICVGLGGGTGSGAAPLVAEVAREQGAFVVVFSTRPFSFEGERRLKQAEVSLNKLNEHANLLIVFENDQMGKLVVPQASVQEAFVEADKLICQSIEAVSNIMYQPGIVRIGRDELLRIFAREDSRCLFGHGRARGDNRAQEALASALKSPLLDKERLLHCRENIIVHVVGGEDLTLYEVEILMKEMSRVINKEAQIHFGIGCQPNLERFLTVSLIASTQIERPLFLEKEWEESVQLEKMTSAPSIHHQEEKEPEQEEVDKIEETFQQEDGVEQLERVEDLHDEPLLEKEEKNSLEQEIDQDDQEEKKREEPESQEEPAQQLLELDPISRGWFEKSEPTIIDGEDLDIPTIFRKKSP